MRILLTADPEVPVPPVGYGGIERIVDMLVRAFRAQGHTLGLVACKGSTSPADARFAWPGRASSGSLNLIRNTLALQRSVRAFRPDILHSFSRLAYLLPVFADRLPKVMSYQRHTGGRQIRVASSLAGRSLRFTGCSEFISGMGRSHGGIWHTVPNFVELQKFTFVPTVADDAPLVFLSRIERIKGPDLAIAIARASGRRLILAGNRPAGAPSRKFWDLHVAPRLGSGVEWIGEVDDIRKNDLLGRAAALLVPIQWDEPFGIVFAEALACGTPILSSRRGALPEIVDEGRTGFFLESVAEGVDRVRKLPQLDRTACRKAAEARFSMEVCSSRYLSIYREAAAAN